MKTSGKNVAYNNIKSHKKPGFHTVSRKHIFRKTKLTPHHPPPPPALLGLNIEDIKFEIEVEIKRYSKKLASDLQGFIIYVSQRLNEFSASYK